MLCSPGWSGTHSLFLLPRDGVGGVGVEIIVVN